MNVTLTCDYVASIDPIGSQIKIEASMAANHIHQAVRDLFDKLEGDTALECLKQLNASVQQPVGCEEE